MLFTLYLLTNLPIQPPYRVEPTPYREVTAVVTAYTAVETCADTCNMFSGKQAYVGAVACPRHIELGTVIEIDDMVLVCEDRTALHTEGRYDIFFGYTEADYQRALEWGVPTKKVKIHT